MARISSSDNAAESWTRGWNGGEEVGRRGEVHRLPLVSGKD